MLLAFAPRQWCRLRRRATRRRNAFSPLPLQVVYDTDIPGVLVNSTLLAADTGAPRRMLGQALILTRCGKAQFTNLQIQTVGSYKMLFSATYLSTKETTNLTSVFEVLPSTQRFCKLCVFLPCVIKSASATADVLAHCACRPSPSATGVRGTLWEASCPRVHTECACINVLRIDGVLSLW